MSARSRDRTRIAVLATAVAVFAAVPAAAGDWRLTLEPYSWGARPNGLFLDVDNAVTFEDTLDPYRSGGFARVRARRERWSIFARTDVAGFGGGGSSELTWNVETMLLFEAGPHVTVAAGFRALDSDYEESYPPDSYGARYTRTRWQMQFPGSVFGLRLRF